MTFNSFSYFLFLPVVYLIFYFTADRWRWLVLLTSSYVFYAFLKAYYLLAVLFVITIISYVFGIRIAIAQDDAVRKCLLWCGIISCVLVLALLRFIPFLNSHGGIILGANRLFPIVTISIGVSYFTFQAISYLADVYLEIEKPEQHLGHFALYLAFFPKLLQGPIERAGDILPQLKKSYDFDYDGMRSGILLFTLGLFKKVVVADRLALYADQVYNHVHDYTGLSLIIGTYAYALQIYFDFSGYTDMARGVGLMFGVNLSENFISPYMATSIADFWRRWHISFSRWILDYIFKPLQMSWRSWGQLGTASALIITFLVSGIWHGATIGFIIWGGLHGVYLASSTYYRPYQKLLYEMLRIENKRWIKFWKMFVTFNLVSFAWIFFRAATISDAQYVALHCFSGVNIGSCLRLIANVGFKPSCVMIVLLIVLALCRYIFDKNSFVSEFYNYRTFKRFIFYVLLVVIIMGMGMFDSSNYIYMNF